VIVRRVFETFTNRCKPAGGIVRGRLLLGCVKRLRLVFDGRGESEFGMRRESEFGTRRESEFAMRRESKEDVDLISDWRYSIGFRFRTEF
jgi:hypothetical protein